MGILDIALAIVIGKIAYEVIIGIYYNIKHRVKMKYSAEYREIFESEYDFIHSEECVCK